MSLGQTTQRMSDITLKRVKKYGIMGDSFETVLSKVLDRIEQGDQGSV